MTRPEIEPRSPGPLANTLLIRLQLITPNCFLRPNFQSKLILKPNVQNIQENGPPSRDVLIKTSKIRVEMLLKFREMRFEEYMLSLRENYKDEHETNNSKKIKTKDVVLIKILSSPGLTGNLGE